MEKQNILWVNYMKKILPLLKAIINLLLCLFFKLYLCIYLYAHVLAGEVAGFSKPVVHTPVLLYFSKKI